jgi:chemotaxis protein CheX
MVDDLFTSMFDTSVELIDGPFDATDPDSFQAAIRINGDWKAELRVIASRGLAESIAQSMFAAEPSELSEEEVLDALGEIANVIGGNVKGIIDQECSLSLPCVGKLEETAQRGDVSQIYRCFEDDLRVSLIED